MRRCGHLDPRVLQELERDGQDDHVDGCESCQDALRALARVEEALSAVGQHLVPDDNWETAIWDRIERKERRTPPRLLWTAPALVGVVAAAALLLVSWPWGGPSPSFHVSVEIKPGATSSRTEVPRSRGSEMAHPANPRAGDSLVVRVAGGDRHSAIWIYRDENTLLLTCPGGSGCTSGKELVAELTLPAGGRYQIVSLSSPRPLPTPSGAFDGDVAAAARAHIRVLTREVELW